MDSIKSESVKRKFGYAWIPEAEQKNDNQIKLLKEYGIDEAHIYNDIISGKDSDWNEFCKLLNSLEENDHIVMVKFDMLDENQLKTVMKKCNIFGSSLLASLENLEQIFKKITIHFIDGNSDFDIGNICRLISSLVEWEKEYILDCAREGKISEVERRFF